MSTIPSELPVGTTPPIPASVEGQDIASGPSELERAGATYLGQVNYFKKMTSRSGMSSKKLARVMVALVEFPLKKGPPRLLDQEERMLFSLFHSVQASKNAFLEELMKEKKMDGETSPESLTDAVNETLSADAEATIPVAAGGENSGTN